MKPTWHYFWSGPGLVEVYAEGVNQARWLLHCGANRAFAGGAYLGTVPPGRYKGCVISFDAVKAAKEVGAWQRQVERGRA